MSPDSGNRTGLLIGVATVMLVLIAWYALTTLTGAISAARFPTPAEVGAALYQITFDGYADAKLHQHILQSSKLILMGFAAAAAIGVPLGLAIGFSRRVEAFFNPVFLLIRPIPPLAWIPLAIVWLGLGDGAKILVIWFAAFVPSVINSYTGVRSVEPHLLEAARTLGARNVRLWLEVLVPGAAPHIFTGLRLSLQAAWTTLIAGELIGALQGLGQVLNAAAQDLNPAMILVGMIFVGLCGGGMTWVLGRIERYSTPCRSA